MLNVYVFELCCRVRKETLNTKRTQCLNLQLQIITNVIKGVLARSRLSTVGFLKLMCINLLVSTCKWYLYLMLLHIRRSVVDRYLHVSHGYRFYLKTGLPDLFFHSKPRPREVKTFVLQGNTALTDEPRHYLVFLFNFPPYLKFLMCVHLIWHFSPSPSSVLLVTGRSASAKT